MSIRKNIEDVMNNIQADSNVGLDIQEKAVNAIKSGEGTTAWRTYMAMFAQNERELARLLPTDETQNVFKMDVARTYLVGNGTCGAETTGFHLIEGVNDTLDENLNP